MGDEGEMVVDAKISNRERGGKVTKITFNQMSKATFLHCFEKNTKVKWC